MRILVFCACILAYASFGTAGNLKEELRKASLLRPKDDIIICFNEVGLTKETILTEEDILNEVHLRSEMQEIRLKNGCGVECLFKKWHMMDESGMKEEGIKAGLTSFLPNSEEAKAEQVTHDCIQQTENLTEPCEKGAKLFECVTKAVHEIVEREEHNEDKA